MSCRRPAKQRLRVQTFIVHILQHTATHCSNGNDQRSTPGNSALSATPPHDSPLHSHLWSNRTYRSAPLQALARQWHEYLIRVTWLIHTRDTTPFYILISDQISVTGQCLSESFLCEWVTRTSLTCAWLIHMCDATHLYILTSYLYSHIFPNILMFIYTSDTCAWLIHTCGTTHL